MWRVAAGLAIFAGAAATWRMSARPAAPEASNAEAPSPSRRTVDLADGSTVVLSPGSSLRTLPGYGEGGREVELSGEALFTVRHDEERPFRIRTASALIEDLGTEFTVRAFDREPVRVAVTEGSVRVRRAGASEAASVVLQPRDMAIVADTGDPIVNRGVDVEAYRAWTRGQLVFRNTTLPEAIREIERWYDLDFRLDANDPLLDRSINVTFDNQAVDEMLQILGLALGTEFEREGRVVRVAPPVRTGMKGASQVQVGSGA